ncbi:permease [Gloeocapsa sp. PCC 73106]|uniref:permease n=1 Tax=Gloeocapsa sp. PCC 73106 TaxID=102232 RepID=UPI0002ABFDF7|nr:permease [Gloeocapsa sp. PCC 73106]ELR97914.1 putative permease [Gloeocapsa sp. PCC 73106]
MTRFHDAFTIFLSLLVEALPFLVLGVVLSSALLLFINEEQLVSRVPRHPILGSMFGSFMGFFLPVCECGNVPVARRFLLQGLPLSMSVGFLLAAPTINPIVIWSTWIVFRDQPEIVWLRILFSWLIATIIACVFSIQRDPRPLLQELLAKRMTIKSNYRRSLLPKKQSSLPLMQGAVLVQKRSNSALISGFLENMSQELRELGGVLILGSAIAATIQVFVPRELIVNLGQGTVSSIVAMMLLAAVVSICSTVDSFFALSFAGTFTSSSLLAFLVFGPMIDLKAVGLMLSIFKPRIIFYLFALAAQLTFMFTLAYSYFF